MHLQTEDDPAQSSTEHDFYGPPVRSSLHVQVRSKGDPREEIREEDIDCASEDELVECSPIANISSAHIPDILLEEATRTE